MIDVITQEIYKKLNAYSACLRIDKDLIDKLTNDILDLNIRISELETLIKEYAYD